MEVSADQMVLHHEKLREQDGSLQVSHPGWGSEDHQLVHHQRLVMQDNILVTGGTGLQLVNEALQRADARAQHHAAELEHRLEMFMHSTHGSLSDVEMRLQERLELALRASQADIMAATTSLARDVHERIASIDEKIGQVPLQLEAALESCQIQAQSTQNSVSAAHVQAYQAQMNATIDKNREWLEDTLSNRANARMSEMYDTLQQQIVETHNNTADSICSLESRMQAKLNEAIAKSEGCRGALTTQINGATRVLEQLVGAKVNATEAQLRNVINAQVSQLEERLQMKLESVGFAADCQMARHQDDFEARVSEKLRSMELRVQNHVQERVDLHISTLEIRLNELLQASSTPPPAATSKQIEASVGKAEARTVQHQEKLYQKAQIAHTAALTQLESRIKMSLQTAKDADGVRMQTALKMHEERIESRLTACIAQATTRERITINKTVQALKQRVMEEKLSITKEIEEIKKQVEEKLRLAPDQAGVTSIASQPLGQAGAVSDSRQEGTSSSTRLALGQAGAAFTERAQDVAALAIETGAANRMIEVKIGTSPPITPPCVAHKLLSKGTSPISADDIAKSRTRLPRQPHLGRTSIRDQAPKKKSKPLPIRRRQHSQTNLETAREEAMRAIAKRVEDRIHSST